MKTDALKSILKMRTGLEGQKVKVGRNSFNLLDLLLSGRNIALMRYTRAKEAAGLSYRYIFPDEEVDRAFLYDLGDRGNLIKFCLATGNEEELDHYLELGGFKTLSEARTWEIQNKTDILTEYAMGYKKALLQKWCRDIGRREPGISEAQARIALNRQFPMIQLLLAINRDIAFVMEYCWQTESFYREERIKQNEKYMIYPVKIQDIWTMR